MNSKKKKPIINIDTGRTYQSIANAAKIHGCNWVTIYQAIGIPYRTAKGYHWNYVNKEDIESNRKRLKQKGIPETKPTNARRIRNIETSETYNSVKEAAEKCYTGERNLFRALKNPSTTAAAYHWEYVDKK